MRKIPIIKWKVSSPKGEELEDSTLSVLNALISTTRPEEMPRGIDNFRLFKRLSSAFEVAEASGTLVLEDADYALLKRIVENGVPAIWAMNKNISEAVNSFLEAKEE